MKDKTTFPLSERIKAKMNQTKFWNRIGCTQSGGSRFESGSPMSKPVRILLALATGKATIEELKSGELADRI